MKREGVYKLIDGERDYQEEMKSQSGSSTRSEMDWEIKKIYMMVLNHNWRPKVEKIINGLHHVYFYRPSKDGIPAVLREPGRSFQECSCCKWKPE